MTLNYIQIASFIAIFQSCFMSIQLWTHTKESTLKNKTLSIYLFILAIQIFCALSVSDGAESYFMAYHQYIFLANQTGFLLGPLLFLYTKYSIINNAKINQNDALHFVIFLIFILLFAFLVLPKSDFILWQYEFRPLNTFLLLLHNLVYLVITLKRLKQTLYKDNITTKIMWLLLVSAIVLWSVQLNILVILNIFHIYTYCPHLTSLYTICAFLFINTIAYFASKKSEFYNQLNKYETSSLKPFELTQYRDKLVHLMVSEKLFLQADLSLSELANTISIPHRQLSQVINESFGCNFYDFINGYRINECKQLLDNCSKDKTIIEIAYAVGFYSKSAFNKAFKKHTGLTPKAYKKGINGSKESS